MKVYTKTGDTGETSLFGGSRVSKGHLRINAYGTVDELNSYIGLLRDLIDSEPQFLELQRIQDRLFTLGAILATEKESALKRLGKVTMSDVSTLESAIDSMEEQLEPLTSFVLPGGHSTVSHIHISRCVCRRAERLCVELSEQTNIDQMLIQYLNRLSDYLFVLSRLMTKKLGVTELPWIPKND